MVLWKATVILIGGGLIGSGIVAVTHPGDAAAPRATAASIDTSNESFQREYVHARVVAQRPFGVLTRASR